MWNLHLAFILVDFRRSFSSFWLILMATAYWKTRFLQSPCFWHESISSVRFSTEMWQKTWKYAKYLHWMAGDLCNFNTKWLLLMIVHVHTPQKMTHFDPFWRLISLVIPTHHIFNTLFHRQKLEHSACFQHKNMFSRNHPHG